MEYTQFNDMDGFSVDSEPTIAELVSEWCLQDAVDCDDSDYKLDSLLSKFPYQTPTSERLHNIAPTSSFHESTVTSQEQPKWCTEASMNLQEFSSLFNNFAKSEKKDAVWNSDSTLFSATDEEEKTALWTNSILQLNDAIGKALTKVDVVKDVRQPSNDCNDDGSDSWISNHSNSGCVEFLPPGLTSDHIFFDEAGSGQLA